MNGNRTNPYPHQSNVAGGEIEVTPEMIAAGVAELVRFDPDWEVEADAVERIFVAMIEARRG